MGKIDCFLFLMEIYIMLNIGVDESLLGPKSTFLLKFSRNRKLSLVFSELFLMVGIKNSVKSNCEFLHCAKWYKWGSFGPKVVKIQNCQTKLQKYKKNYVMIGIQKERKNEFLFYF